jgi:DNA-directed RNA polymerase specialized sigma24 family protein
MLETNIKRTTVEQAISDPKIRKDLSSHARNFTKQKEDAEDLVQETITKAREKQEKFKDGSNIR